MALTAVAQVEQHDAWSDDEWQRIRSLWIGDLPTQPIDSSNSVQLNPNAAKLGKKLFFDKRFSLNGTIACASCHQPKRMFTDGRAIARGIAMGRRNTPSLLGTVYSEWFFWDGRKDSLWSQAIAPLEDKSEHGLTRTAVIKHLIEDDILRTFYQQVFGDQLETIKVDNISTPASPLGTGTEIKRWKKLDKSVRRKIDQVFANIGKSIAAYVATLSSAPARFDRYIEDVEISGQSSLLNEGEKAGLKLFIGTRAGCFNCHSGPLLTNGGFHNIGTGTPGSDSGRSVAIQQVRWDRFNCLGEFSDASEQACLELRYISDDKHALAGAFKVPSLRNSTLTAPYMHDGRFGTLNAVLDHYTTVSNQKKSHIPMIKLSDIEKRHMVLFLATLVGKTE